MGAVGTCDTKGAFTCYFRVMEMWINIYICIYICIYIYIYINVYIKISDKFVPLYMYTSFPFYLTSLYGIVCRMDVWGIINNG